MCTNHALYEKECISYIQKLHIPKGFQMEVLTVKDALSMTAGYNEAMSQSDAKYKVYLHQDVFIIHKNFLDDLLKLFEHKEIGMVGMVGSTNIKEHAVMWYSERVGKLYSNSAYRAGYTLFGEVSGSYQQVDAVDGLLMATQYDIPWREDILKNWDFYDVSQSLEFQKRGYQVVVPAAEQPWCIHDDGILNLGNYYKEREIIVKEYGLSS